MAPTDKKNSRQLEKAEKNSRAPKPNSRLDIFIGTEANPIVIDELFTIHKLFKPLAPTALAQEEEDIDFEEFQDIEDLPDLSDEVFEEVQPLPVNQDAIDEYLEDLALQYSSDHSGLHLEEEGEKRIIARFDEFIARFRPEQNPLLFGFQERLRFDPPGTDPDVWKPTAKELRKEYTKALGKEIKFRLQNGQSPEIPTIVRINRSDAFYFVKASPFFGIVGFCNKDEECYRPFVRVYMSYQ